MDESIFHIQIIIVTATVLLAVVCPFIKKKKSKVSVLFSILFLARISFFYPLLLLPYGRMFYISE